MHDTPATGPAVEVLHSRRRFLARMGIAAATIGASLGVARWFEPGAFAQELDDRVRTPRMTEGPYYPDRLPLDTDNDLLIVNDAITPAVGEVTHLEGTILDARGDPVRNALIEIWQTDSKGSYIHSEGLNRQGGGKRDASFQGYGRFLTGSAGQYYFRTIKPVVYPGRTPHIHVMVSVGGKEQLTTQCFVKGHPMNARDMVLNEVRDERARASVQVEFAPLEGSRIGELTARFDVVLGFTPPERAAKGGKAEAY